MQALFKSVTGIKSYKSYYNDKVTKDKITSMTSKISDLQDKYDAMEEIYYAKFTAMEKALATLNSQSSSFLSMLG
jgi:flagellar hook-associated protein 2